MTTDTLIIKLNQKQPNVIKQELLSLYPDDNIRLSDLVSKVRKQKYSTFSPSLGRKLSYRRICTDFKNGICVRKWGKKEGKILVKMDGNDNWTYLGWINKEEIN